MPRTVFRLVLASFVSGAWLLAQEPPYTLRVDVPFVSVDVTVTDAAGKIVGDLAQNDFDLFEDGIRQKIRYFSPVSAPYNIFLLFDRSGSTQHKWPFMQKAVAGFIANLRPQDRIAIGTFDYEFQMHVDWTGDRGKAVVALPDLIRPKAIGGTNFYDALEHVLSREFRKVTGRRALVVLTDGRDTSLYREIFMKNRVLDPSEDRGYQKVFKAARQQRLPAYFVAVNTDRNFEPNTQGGDEYRNLMTIYGNSSTPRQYLTQVRIRMEQIAEVTGGRILFPARIEDIVPLYEQAGRELGTAYSLGYVSSNAPSNGAFRKIEVRTREGGLKLSQSRTGYYAR